MGEKKHIGAILDLSNETDAEINNILNNLPSYSSKSKFIRKAILYYHKNGDNLNHEEASPAMTGNSETNMVLKNLMQLVSTMQDEMDQLQNTINDMKNNGENTADTEDNAPAVEKKPEKKQVKKEKKAPVKEEKVEEPVKEEIVEEDNDSADNIEIDTDTKKTGRISYEDLMGEFFK